MYVFECAMVGVKSVSKNSPQTKIENIRKLKVFFVFLIWYIALLELITLWVIINHLVGRVQLSSVLIHKNSWF